MAVLYKWWLDLGAWKSSIVSTSGSRVPAWIPRLIHNFTLASVKKDGTTWLWSTQEEEWMALLEVLFTGWESISCVYAYNTCMATVYLTRWWSRTDWWNKRSGESTRVSWHVWQLCCFSLDTPLNAWKALPRESGRTMAAGYVDLGRL